MNKNYKAMCITDQHPAYKKGDIVENIPAENMILLVTFRNWWVDATNFTPERIKLYKIFYS